jgi:uncharacterized protein YjdB
MLPYFWRWPMKRFLSLLTAAALALSFTACSGDDDDDGGPIAVKGVTLQATLEIEVDDNGSLTATVVPANAANQAVAWESYDPTVAAILPPATGATVTVHALKVGNTKVSVETEDGKFKKECTVTVIPTRVKTITVTPSQTSILPGGSTTLTATVLPDNAANKAYTWSSSAPNIASVSTTGFVMGLTPGPATIRATAQDGSNVSGACEVTVTPILVESVTLAPATLPMAPGGTSALTVTVLPAAASNKSVAFSTSEATVATVSQEGVVTAVAAGSATITATAVDGSGKFGTCAVTVGVASTGIVHVAGEIRDDDVNGYAALWIFGESETRRALRNATPGSMANSVYAQGNNVYVVGHNDGYAAIWVNNEAPLTLDSGTATESVAKCVTVGGPSNNWVRIVGTTGPMDQYDPAIGDRRARVWAYAAGEVDSWELSPNSQSEAFSVCFTTGNQPSMIVGGYEMVGGVKKARVWREGQALSLNGDVDNAEVRVVCVSDSDIYSAAVARSNFKDTVTVRKNSDIIGTISSTGHMCEFGGLAVSGSDWYVTAYSTDPGVAGMDEHEWGAAVVYKNGAGSVLGDFADGDPLGITVFGDYVYVTGYLFESPYPGNFDGTGAVWENSVRLHWLYNVYGNENRTMGRAIFVK